MTVVTSRRTDARKFAATLHQASPTKGSITAGGQRLSETVETRVVWLITQRPIAVLRCAGSWFAQAGICRAQEVFSHFQR